jgi:hypothetical protein
LCSSSGAQPEHMSSTQTKSILRSFIVVPMIASSLSLNAFTASVDQFVSMQSADITVSAQERLLQKEREEKASKIDTYLAKRNMPLAGHGMKMVLEAEKNDLDWRLIPAMAVRESTGGKFACKKFPENAWGWHSCKAGLGGSTENAIELIAQHLSGNHPRTARYYASKETNKQILQTYNPPSVVATYADEVIRIMDQIEDTII